MPSPVGRPKFSPTPPQEDRSERIATTEWTEAVMQSAVPVLTAEWIAALPREFPNSPNQFWLDDEGRLTLTKPWVLGADSNWQDSGMWYDSQVWSDE